MAFDPTQYIRSAVGPKPEVCLPENVAVFFINTEHSVDEEQPVDNQEEEPAPRVWTEEEKDNFYQHVLELFFRDPLDGMSLPFLFGEESQAEELDSIPSDDDYGFVYYDEETGHLAADAAGSLRRRRPIPF